MKAGTVCRSLSGEIVRETEKAILFQVTITSATKTEHAVTQSHWFPISQLSSIHRTYDEIDGTFDVIMASEWILGQKGLLKYAGVAGVAGVNTIKDAEFKQNFPALTPPVMRTLKDTSANRMPYKDDEGTIYGILDDDIPF